MVYTAQLREHSERLTHIVNAIRAEDQLSPSVVCRTYRDLFFGLRHLQLDLPESDQYRVTRDVDLATPPGTPVACVREGQSLF